MLQITKIARIHKALITNNQNNGVGLYKGLVKNLYQARAPAPPAQVFAQKSSQMQNTPKITPLEQTLQTFV